MVASLKKFMETKPLSRITVSEICKDCGFNRKTFYYHFEDITVAKCLEQNYGRRIVEMDEQIEAQEQMPVSRIFEEKGEEYFRGLETELQ